MKRYVTLVCLGNMGGEKDLVMSSIRVQCEEQEDRDKRKKRAIASYENRRLNEAENT